MLAACALTLFALVCAADGHHPPGWAVATAHPLATAAAREVAAQGGNAFDAAVAVSAVLAVAEPMGSGLGGGGFWLLHRAADGFQIMIDGRERAPMAAHRDMYLDVNGDVRPGASLDGPLAAGIPGEPAALVHLADNYGRLDLAESLAPAIRIAHEGFAVGDRFRSLLEFRRDALNPAARQVLLTDGEIPELGALLKQPDLAATLELIAANGRNGFYSGVIAARMVTEVRQAGGIWQPRDLARFRITERTPVYGDFRNARIVTAAPPSSGGIILIQMLNMLESLDPAAGNTVTRRHHLIEVMRRAYRDRAEYLGDSDYVDIDQARLTGKRYARTLIRDLGRRATPSADLKPPNAGAPGSGSDTTHFSIIDAAGNRVAATLSINYPFGSGFMAAGTGVLLNNEMDDFVAKPGVANVYGLVGGSANQVAPGKRPLSSMTPTFVETENQVAVLGTPGGSRIITMVLLAVLDLLDAGPDNLQEIVDRPRLHHQYLPDHVTYERGALDATTASALMLRGHRLEPRSSPYGNMQAVAWDRIHNKLSAASDRRGEGEARVW